MLDFSTLLKDLDAMSIDPFLAHIHSLLAYSQSHRSVIKLRDQKQLDFEELSAYLSAVVAERDRLAALNTGHSGAPIGFTTYLRDKVDQLRGTDDIHTRRERMKKLDVKIVEVRDFSASLSHFTLPSTQGKAKPEISDCGLIAARSGHDCSRDHYRIQ